LGYFAGAITGEQPYGTAQSYSGTEGFYGAMGYPTWCGAPNDYNSNNYYWVCYGEAPAYWNITYTLNFLCGTKNLTYQDSIDNIYQYTITNQEVFLTSGAEGDCYTQYVPPASTRFAILGQLPQTLTLSGEAPFVTTYGMPELYVYDGTATLVATETATSVSSDSSQATFPFPSSLQQNGYSVAVANQIGSNPGISAVGTNYLSIASSQTISGNPFGVAAGGLTESAETCKALPHGQENCTTTNYPYAAFPLVSLYGQNKVYNGRSGGTISVGASPTAIITLPAGQETQYFDNNLIQNTYTGTTRAIVANSGGNTVSILDTVSNVVLSNVTVGNQPVALVASSNGSNAYVANYADSTVTQVNLSTDTATATVAVGGNPTSVALTAAGILWVGGVGFLTEINTSNMSLVATESTSGKTIAGLGFSDAENELIATSTVGSGSVSIDEVSPSSVQPGGLYTPAASQSVSTLGTYFNPRIQAQSFGFTGTLTSSMVPISTAQVGAPPLVVQDGWAAVSATPTGFTITDLSGNIVLVSETTPSPIAAIAVDSNLSQAYLTMPDSNTLLTVPLP
jgi:YVTN family beta-propeller protein